MASLKRIEQKSGRVVYRIVICMGYDVQGKKLVKNLTYSVNQSATPKQQEKEALKYALSMEDKLKYGYEFDAEKISFEEFVYKWLESVKVNVAYSTYAGYVQIINKRIIPYFKDYKLKQVKTPHIEGFYKTLVDNYASGTIKRFASVINNIFQTAIRWDMLDKNPCLNAQLPKKKEDNSKIKFFTPEQSKMFLKSLDITYKIQAKGTERNYKTGLNRYVDGYVKYYTIPIQYKVFFCLSLLCGFRKGETLALHWNDIDFETNQISINKAVGLTENGFDYKETKTPTSVRTVNIPNVIVPLLKEYRQEYALRRLKIGTAWKGDLSNGGNLFAQANGELPSECTTYNYFKKHIKRYNDWVKSNPQQAKEKGLEELPNIPLHGLRHSYATMLNHLDVNIIDISKSLGHAKCSTTMNIYAHSFDEHNKTATNKLNNFIMMKA